MTETAFREGVVALLDPIVGNRVAVDAAPIADWNYPHIILFWDISNASALDGDARTLALAGEFQVDIRQKIEVEQAGTMVVTQVISALNGVKVAGRRLKIRSIPRQQDASDNSVVRHIMTVSTRGASLL